MEDYKDQSKVKTQSTASLLGIRQPNVTYKKPLPVDTINYSLPKIKTQKKNFQLDIKFIN